MNVVARSGKESDCERRGRRAQAERGEVRASANESMSFGVADAEGERERREHTQMDEFVDGPSAMRDSAPAERRQRAFASRLYAYRGERVVYRAHHMCCYGRNIFGWHCMFSVCLENFLIKLKGKIKQNKFTPNALASLLALAPLLIVSKAQKNEISVVFNTRTQHNTLLFRLIIIMQYN